MTKEVTPAAAGSKSTVPLAEEPPQEALTAYSQPSTGEDTETSAS